jgi:hypothetical protein
MAQLARAGTPGPLVIAMAEHAPKGAILFHKFHVMLPRRGINSSGTFDVTWQSINPVRAEPWSRYLPDSAKRTADWTSPRVCGGALNQHSMMSDSPAFVIWPLLGAAKRATDR